MTITSYEDHDPGLHLLLDSHAVQTAVGLRHRVEPPRRRALSPVLAADRPWEGSCVGRPMVLPEAGGLRAWYIAHIQERSGQGVLCTAVSADGLAWTRPDGGELGDNRVYAPAEWAAATGRTPRQFECSGIVSDPHAATP